MCEEDDSGPTVSETAETAKRTRGGRFARGTQPGPGRPKGARSKLSAALDRVVAADAEAVVASLMTAAKAGDVGAARVVLDRVWPPAKGRAVALALPPVGDATGLVGALAALVAAMGDGEITPDEARVIAAVLAEQRMAIEAEDLARRVEALEAAAAVLGEDEHR